MMIRSTYYTSLLFLITIVVICNQNIFGNCIKTTPHVGQRPMGDRNFLGRKKTVPSTGASSIDRSISAHRYSPKVREKFNKKKEDRKRSMASLQSTQTYGLEDINCDAIGATGYACRNYMLAYLNDYVVKNGTYNPIQLPVPENSDIPQVELLVTFMDLLEIDVVTGTMTTSLFIDMFWTDEIIPEWNVSLTDGIDELVVPNGLLWEPDIQVYNSIGAYFDQIDSYAVFLYPDGLVWWSGRGMFTFSCEFDVTEFPFDSQSCQIQFASWIYSITSVNLSSVTMDINPGFSNLAWEVDSVTAAREVVIQWEVYAFPYGIYTINISRYSSHYVTTTIMPALIITVIVIIGLFIPNHASRLSLCVTGLLTIIAIQVWYSLLFVFSDGGFAVCVRLLTMYGFLVVSCVCICSGPFPRISLCRTRPTGSLGSC